MATIVGYVACAVLVLVILLYTYYRGKKAERKAWEDRLARTGHGKLCICADESREVYFYLLPIEHIVHAWERDKAQTDDAMRYANHTYKHKEESSHETPT